LLNAIRKITARGTSMSWRKPHLHKIKY
jgi:hypothetical protein